MSSGGFKAAGIDVHRRVLVCSIKEESGYMHREFHACLDGYFELGEWLVANQCQRVALEATGVYWYRLYLVLSERLRVVVANPFKIKHVPGRKTDQRDSEWLAHLCANDMITPSRVFTGMDREVRELTRTRENLVHERTMYKNRVHRLFELESVKLASCFTDCFGKQSRSVMQGLLLGQDIEEAMRSTKGLSKERKELLRVHVKSRLDPLNVSLLKRFLGKVDMLEKEIKRLDKEIKLRLVDRSDYHVLLSIPGVGPTAAATILSEIGCIDDFEDGERLASYFGLVPSVYQSAGKTFTGRITKQGSGHMRRILVQVAHTLGRMKNNRLSMFYRKMKERKGAKIAATALSRKLLCIIHHLLKNNEPYKEDEWQKKVKLRKPRDMIEEMTYLEIVDTLARAVKTIMEEDQIQEWKGVT